jgi:hypothetical protein
MSSYYDYDDYRSIADDSEDLYTYDDQWDYDDVEAVDHNEWENYYHNITDELVDE